jgi:pSer/pThr/pTyr-binding forkhead associated (FHA) protein
VTPLADYRALVVAGEEVRSPVLLAGFATAIRPSEREFRTATRDATTSLPPFDTVLADPATCVLILEKAGKNPYEGFVFVGRASTSDVVIRDASISKSHAAFDYAYGAWHVRDNRSHNGTSVNGRRLASGERVRIESRDALVFGAYPVYVVMPDDLKRLIERSPRG